jgi:hypothetical protein
MKTSHIIFVVSLVVLAELYALSIGLTPSDQGSVVWRVALDATLLMLVWEQVEKHREEARARDILDPTTHKHPYENNYLTYDQLAAMEHKPSYVEPVEVDKGGHKKYDGVSEVNESIKHYFGVNHDAANCSLCRFLREARK